jgi:hypothetical protein
MWDFYKKFVNKNKIDITEKGKYFYFLLKREFLRMDQETHTFIHLKQINIIPHIHHSRDKYL